MQSARIVLHIEREMSLHLDYCASFGLSKKDIENFPETLGMQPFSLSLLTQSSNLQNRQHARHTADSSSTWANRKTGSRYKWL